MRAHICQGSGRPSFPSSPAHSPKALLSGGTAEDKGSGGGKEEGCGARGHPARYIKFSTRGPLLYAITPYTQAPKRRCIAAVTPAETQMMHSGHAAAFTTGQKAGGQIRELLLLIAAEERSHNAIQPQAGEPSRAARGDPRWRCCVCYSSSYRHAVHPRSSVTSGLTRQDVFVSVLLDVLLLLSCIGGVNLLRPVFCRQPP